MAAKASIHTAKTHLSSQVEQLLADDGVVIAKACVKPILGGAIGAIKFRKDWDAPMTDEETISLFDSGE
jgi:hypothetical protein